MSVWLMVAAALVIVGLPSAFIGLHEVRDHFYPWARDPAHVVVHVENDSPGAVTLSYGAATWSMLYPPASPTPLASGDRSHQTLHLPAGIPGPVTLELEFTVAPFSAPLALSVPVLPDEHLLYRIDSRGVVTLTRGHESRVGYPVFASASAVMGSR